MREKKLSNHLKNFRKCLTVGASPLILSDSILVHVNSEECLKGIRQLFHVLICSQWKVALIERRVFFPVKLFTLSTTPSTSYTYPSVYTIMYFVGGKLEVRVVFHQHIRSKQQLHEWENDKKCYTLVSPRATILVCWSSASTHQTMFIDCGSVYAVADHLNFILARRPKNERRVYFPRQFEWWRRKVGPAVAEGKGEISDKCVEWAWSGGRGWKYVRQLVESSPLRSSCGHSKIYFRINLKNFYRMISFSCFSPRSVLFLF